MTTKTIILKAIRHKCIDCCVGQLNEVRLCAAVTCDLWPYRFGVDPNPSQTGFAKNPSRRRGVLDKEVEKKGGPSSNYLAASFKKGLSHD